MKWTIGATQYSAIVEESLDVSYDLQCRLPMPALTYLICKCFVALTSDMTVEVVESGEVLELFADDKSQSSQHSNPAMNNLRLAPSVQFPDRSGAGCSPGQQISWIEDVGKRVGDTWHRLGICSKKGHQKHHSAFNYAQTSVRAHSWLKDL